jgi:hypothetical protein
MHQEATWNVTNRGEDSLLPYGRVEMQSETRTIQDPTPDFHLKTLLEE